MKTTLKPSKSDSRNSFESARRRKITRRIYPPVAGELEGLRALPGVVLADDISTTTVRRKRTARALGAASAAALSAMFATDAHAGTYVSYGTGSTYVQNFNSLDATNVAPSSIISGGSIATGGTIGDLSTAGFGTTASTTAISNPGSGMTGWYFSGVSKDNFAVANATDGAGAGGITSTGTLWSFGASAGTTNRALGVVAASGSGAETFGVELINTGSTNLNSMTITFDAAQWRVSSATNALTFGYETAASTSTLPLTGTNTDTKLNFSASQTSGTASTINGSAGGNFTTLTDTISLSGAGWQTGSALWLTFSIPVATQGAGIGIDNFSLSAASISSALNLVWNPGNTNWNTSLANTNWLNGSSSAAYTEGSSVSFTGAGMASPSSGHVVVDAGGVNPGSMLFSNTGSTYSVSGGSIGGPGGLLKTNSGSLVLNNGANSFSGGVTINGGTLEVAGDSSLGITNGGVNLDGGSVLRFDSGNTTSARTVTVSNLVASGGATFDTQGNTVAVSRLIVGGGLFTKTGSGLLSVSSAASFGTSASLAIGAGTLEISGTGVLELQAAPSHAMVGNLKLDNAARADFNGGVFDGGGTIFVAASGSSIDDAGTAVTAVVNNGISLNSNNVSGAFVTYIGATSGNQLTLGGPITGASDVIYASGPSGGAGILVLNAKNTYSGAISGSGPTSTINGATTGVVALGIDNAIPTNSTLVFGVGSQKTGTLDLAGFGQTLAGINVGTSASVNGIASTGADTSTLTIIGTGSSYSGTIGTPADQTNLLANGAGLNDIKLVLGAANTGTFALTSNNPSDYTGGTSVLGGTLLVNTTIGSTSTVSVGSSATLAGKGSINSAATISLASGATIAPGSSGTSSTGTFSIGSLVAATGSNFSFKLSTPGTGGGPLVGTGSKIAATGTVILPTTAGAVNVSLADAGSAGIGIYKLFSYGTLSGANVNFNSTFNVTDNAVSHAMTRLINNSANSEVDLQVANVVAEQSTTAENTPQSSNLTIAYDPGSHGYYGRTDVNGSAGSQTMTIAIDRSSIPTPPGFISPNIFLFQFEPDSATPHTSDSTDLANLETDLTSYGFTYRDFNANNDGGSSQTAMGQALSLNPQYDLAIQLDGPSDTTAFPTTYLNFDFSQYGSLTAYNVAAVPEPASLSLIGISVVGLLGRRRKRGSQKARALQNAAS